MSRLDPVHVKIMREFAKKKSDASFKKFVQIRNEVIKILKEEMLFWADKEDHEKYLVNLEKKFNKENFPAKGIEFIERYLKEDNKRIVFRYWI